MHASSGMHIERIRSTPSVAEMLDAVAHDARNELSVLRGAAELVGVADGPDVAELRDEALLAAERLECMVARLAFAARVECGRAPEVIAAPAAAVADRAAHRAHREGLTAAVAIVGDDVAVLVDPAWGERVLADALHGVGPAAEIRIRVDAGRHEHEVEFVVAASSGPGITPNRGVAVATDHDFPRALGVRMLDIMGSPREPWTDDEGLHVVLRRAGQPLGAAR